MPGSSVSLKPPSNLALLFNEFNDFLTFIKIVSPNK